MPRSHFTSPRDRTRRCGRRGCPGGTPQDRAGIWHARGTRGERPIVNVCRRPGSMAVGLAFQSAPGRIRTRDPLLRRQLLCPAELRALERNCAWRRSRDGYMKVAVCRSLTPCHLGKQQAASPPRTPQPPRLPHPAVSRRVPPGRPANQPGAPAQSASSESRSNRCNN